MSADENTRLAQSAYEAFGRGDMAALAEAMTDDIEWVNPGDLLTTRTPERSTARKLSWAGLVVSHRLSTSRSSSRSLHRPERQGGVHGVRRGNGSGHRPRVCQSRAHVWTFRDGKVARCQVYLDTAATAAAHRVE